MNFYFLLYVKHRSLELCVILFSFLPIFTTLCDNFSLNSWPVSYTKIMELKWLVYHMIKIPGSKDNHVHPGEYCRKKKKNQRNKIVLVVIDLCSCSSYHLCYLVIHSWILAARLETPFWIKFHVLYLHQSKHYFTFSYLLSLLKVFKAFQTPSNFFTQIIFSSYKTT